MFRLKPAGQVRGRYVLCMGEVDDRHVADVTIGKRRQTPLGHHMDGQAGKRPLSSDPSYTTFWPGQPSITVAHERTLLVFVRQLSERSGCFAPAISHGVEDNCSLADTH